MDPVTEHTGHTEHTEHTADAEPQPPVRELTRPQRRVLGVLVEKAFTTPEYYPLTLKAIVSGSNQKSNRDPVTAYSDEQVLEALEGLRASGLVAVVHTESGRTERYRHYVRQRYSFSEPQIAILTELLLRGRQAPGELRARASRMVAIDGLERLREELSGLIEQGYVRTSGPLERRGVEIDHTFYPASEGREPPRESAGVGPAPQSTPSPAEHPASPAPPVSSAPGVEEAIEELRQADRELREELDAVRDEVRRLNDRVEAVQRDLGG